MFLLFCAFFGSWGTKDDIVLNHQLNSLPKTTQMLTFCQKTPHLFPSQGTMMKVKGSPPGEIGGKTVKKVTFPSFDSPLLTTPPKSVKNARNRDKPRLTAKRECYPLISVFKVHFQLI